MKAFFLGSWAWCRVQLFLDVSGSFSEFAISSLLDAGFLHALVGIHNDRLDHDDEFTAIPLFVGISAQEGADDRDLVETRKTGVVGNFVVGDESSQNNGGAIGNADRRSQFLRLDGGDGISTDITICSQLVVVLSDRQVHLLVGVNQGNHLQFKYHGLVLDGGSNAVYRRGGA